MIEISIGIIGAILLTLFLWAFLTFLLLAEAQLDHWKEMLLVCAFTAAPFALAWFIYLLQYSGVIVFVQ